MIKLYFSSGSKCILDYSLNSSDDGKGRTDHSIDLSNFELTTLSSHVQYLTFYRELNVSNNNLGKKLHQLIVLKECQTLDLSNNGITSLKAFPTLSCLKILLLSSNQITDHEEIINVMKQHNLTKLDLKSNPISDLDSLVNKIKDISPNVEVVV